MARTEFAYKAMKPGNVFRDAERRRARFVALIGSDEVEQDTLTVKNLATGQQTTVPTRDLLAFLKGQLALTPTPLENA